MTIIKGKIDSLQQIKDALDKKGISRFSSVGELNSFMRNFALEEEKVKAHTKEQIENEIVDFNAKVKRCEKEYEDKKENSISDLNEQSNRLKHRISKIEQRNYGALLEPFVHLIKVFLEYRIESFERNFERIVRNKTSEFYLKLQKAEREYAHTKANKDELTNKRTSGALKELYEIKDLISSLNPLIAGAIGENKVVKTLSNLPSGNILFNDFKINFDPPIYNKREKEQIFSIQIDHLLVSKSGIYIIETKNWSKESIERYDLRSPVSQIQRSSYALFTMMNDALEKGFIKVNSHHWGKTTIPTRSIIAMINHKPNEKFKYVAIKKLDELQGYISYFEPILSVSEVHVIADYLDYKSV